MNAPRGHVTTGKASLIGGIVVAIASMVLWVAVAHELGFHGPIVLVAGLLVSVATGAWTRLADL
jgi:ribose/xylose/arabinose/galactoside ABC-type transport system permease subunit